MNQPIWGVGLSPQVMGATPSQDQLPRFAFSDIVISNDLGLRGTVRPGGITQ